MSDEHDEPPFERELRLRDMIEQERAEHLRQIRSELEPPAELAMRREETLPDGRRAVFELVPELGVPADMEWLRNLPARSRLRITLRWATLFVSPAPDHWYDMPGKWLAQLVDEVATPV